MSARTILFAPTLAALVWACVPPGNSTGPGDAGTTTAAPTFRASPNVMTAVFEDNFDRSSARPAPSLLPQPFPSASAAPSSSVSVVPHPSASALVMASASASAPASASPQLAPMVPDDLGPNWRQANTSAWHIENGRLCGQRAQNHGVWLTRVLPVNARIEFDAISESPDGDLKAEVWGDGQSSATAISYTNATSYLTILGGWQNKFHVLARINEHGNDRKQIVVDKSSDDPREKPVEVGQIYHFKVERNDGHSVRWYVNGLEYLTYDDKEPLAGIGHDHFGFNDWNVKVCFDNVKVTPLP